MKLLLPLISLVAIQIVLSPMIAHGQTRPAPATTKITVTIDRGRDIGQSFGSLFEATSDDGSLVLGAGFQNAYNTRYRADRHAVQFFVRPAKGERTFTTERLQRPNDLCGTYLYGRFGGSAIDGKVKYPSERNHH